jgi:TonB family protein
MRLVGQVVIAAIVDVDGRVARPKVLKGAQPILDNLAMDAVSHWTFEPASCDENPIPVYLGVTVTFSLK